MLVSKRRLAPIGALVLAAGLLAACGSTAGAAAVIGDSRITESQLGAAVDETLAAQGSTVREATTEVTMQVLNRMVTTALVEKLAADLDVSVTQGNIDEVLASYDEQAGGREEVEAVFAQQGIAPTQIDGVIRLNLLAGAIGAELDPTGDEQSQQGAVVDAVIALGDDIGVDVNPRFGAWDGPSLAVVPAPDDLSVVAASE